MPSDTQPPQLATEFAVMPRRGAIVGSVLLMVMNGVTIAAAPEEHRLLTIVIMLVVATCLGLLIAHFLRLRCRLEVLSTYRALRWSVGEEHHQLGLDEIVCVTTLLDESSDENAHHVVFELRNGKPVRLSDYSWSLSHAAKLAGRVREFLEFAQKT